jgi:hypothetical protein
MKVRENERSRTHESTIKNKRMNTRTNELERKKE